MFVLSFPFIYFNHENNVSYFISISNWMVRMLSLCINWINVRAERTFYYFFFSLYFVYLLVGMLFELRNTGWFNTFHFISFHQIDWIHSLIKTQQIVKGWFGFNLLLRTFLPFSFRSRISVCNFGGFFFCDLPPFIFNF